MYQNNNYYSLKKSSLEIKNDNRGKRPLKYLTKKVVKSNLLEGS